MGRKGKSLFHIEERLSDNPLTCSVIFLPFNNQVILGAGLPFVTEHSILFS